METELKDIRDRALAEIKAADDKKFLEQLRIKYLGRKGRLTLILRSLKDLSLEERRKIGPQAQQLKKELEERIREKHKKLPTSNFQPPTSQLDITKPGEKIKLGHLHPISKVEEEIRQIFLSMNFSAVAGPEIEDEYHNFTALNIPPDHPAREMHDTFWLKPENSEFLPAGRHGRMQNAEFNKNKNSKFLIHNSKLTKTGKFLLRTHTSPVQIRYMEKHQPPFQIIAPGIVYRHEATDATHEFQFSQLEGLMVGNDVSLANFKFVVEEFFKKFFKGQKIDFCFVPSYYPFVEPGLDVAIKLKTQNSKLKTDTWLEVAGAGMVHRKVFEAVGYNPYEWQGFAFGFGVTRLAMIKYNIPDIRLFNSGDLRFIKQF